MSDAKEKTKDAQPVFTTENIDDLHDLLGKAEQWADKIHREGIAAEFRDAREFVEEELVEDEEVEALAD